ncbi:MAG: MFS transporter [Caldilineae bacterium]|nr:MFS transporter [Chloroflexota bacterium]MCB9175612.1 MFS transporter [Caldilineae bacterium]
MSSPADPGSTDARPGPIGSSGYGELLRRNRNFRRYWCGELISLIGDWFNLIASASLLVTLTDSGVALGALFVLRMLTPFAVSPLAGLAADRYNRKHLMIAASLLRGLIVLGFLAIDSPDEVWLLYALTGLQLGVSGFFVPARSAILPELVSRRELGAANAIDSVTWSSMLAFGAALGGLVAGRWGVRTAFLVDAASFGLSALILSRIAYQPGRRIVGSARDAVGQYLDGLHYLVRRPDLLFTALHKAAFGLLVSGGVSVSMVALSGGLFAIGEGGSTSLGMMYAAIGVGTGIGPLVTRWWTGDRPERIRWSLTLAYLVSSAGLLLIAVSVLAGEQGPGSGFAQRFLAWPAMHLGAWSGLAPETAAAFLVFLGATFVRAVGGGVNWVQSAQLLLMQLPSRVRGRVFASEFAVFTLGEASGAALGGWLLDHSQLGVAGLMRLEAGLVLVPALLWSLWVLGRRRLLARAGALR